MAIKAGDIFWAFTGDMSGLKASLAESEATAATTGQQAAARFGTEFSSGLKSLVAPLAVGAIGLGLVSFLKDSVSAAADEEAAMARLGATLKANVPDWDGNTDAIKASIDANTQLGFTQQDLTASFGSLVTATHDVADAQSAQALAMDLARFKGISLADATQQLVSVEAGRYRGLANLGINIDATATKTQALAKVQAAVAGQSKAFGDTFAGSMTELGTELADAGEKIGEDLSGPIKAASDFLKTDLVPGIEGLISSAEKAVPDMSEVARGIDTIKTAAEDAAGPVADLGNSLGIKMPQSLGDFISSLIPANLAMDGQAEAALKSRLLTKDWTGATLDATGAAKGLTGGLGDAGTAAGTTADTFNSNLIPSFFTLKGNGDDATAALDLFIAAENAAHGSTDGLSGAVSDFSDHLIDAEHNANALAVALLGLPFVNKNGSTGKSADIAGQLGGLVGSDSTNNTGGMTTEDVFDQKNQAALQAALAAQSAAAKGAKSSGAAQSAAAKASQQAVDAAFQAEGTAGDAFFQKIHDATIKRAQQQHDELTTEIANERSAIATKLQMQEAANNAPVTALQKTLAADQYQEQLGSLTRQQQAAAVALAQNTDPTQNAQLAQALTDANNALRDFNLQTQINTAQATADAANKQAQTDADTANKALDAKQKAADAQLKADQTAADTQLAQYKKNLATSLAALQKNLDDGKITTGKAQDDLVAILKAYGLPWHDSGVALVTALAKGMDETQWKAEQAAGNIAKAINKYLPHSPAELGPLHDDPPDAAGEAIDTMIGDGLIKGIPSLQQQAGDVMSAVVKALMPGAIKPLAGGTVTPITQDPNFPFAGGGFDPSVSHVPGTMNPDGTINLPGGYVGVGSSQVPTRTPLTDPGDFNSPVNFGGNANTPNPGTAYAGTGGYNPASMTRPGHTFNFYNPAPEPASNSAQRALQRIAAFGPIRE